MNMLADAGKFVRSIGKWAINYSVLKNIQKGRRGPQHKAISTMSAAIKIRATFVPPTA